MFYKIILWIRYEIAHIIELMINENGMFYAIIFMFSIELHSLLNSYRLHTNQTNEILFGFWGWEKFEKPS